MSVRPPRTQASSTSVAVMPIHPQVTADASSSASHFTGKVAMNAANDGLLSRRYSFTRWNINWALAFCIFPVLLLNPNVLKRVLLTINC
ncbi:uncharacterized protein G2W53_011777 [Senna tora]|uniref:Uncharacterized protein n=1 Tax=Senna tora TaxID=362788 RepID=A0A834WSF6_9FABA|nr:uncharacterized protein G2W53_011777 [Senna tora]